MKKLLLLTLACFHFISCTQKEIKSENPQFWCWLSYNNNVEFEKVCSNLKESGIYGLLLHADAEGYKKAIPIASKFNIKIHAWQWIMNLQDRDTLHAHQDWLSINRNGHSLADSIAYVGYYKFMCPAIPEVRNYIYNKIENLLKIEGLEGISLDYHRFVDVILPEKLWDKYGIVQDKEYPKWDYGYHPAMIEKFKDLYNYSPLEKEDPSQDSLWLQFRYNQITEIALEIGKLCHSYNKSVSASPFPTPSIARRIVRQDWDKWNLDLVFPMIYNGFYAEEGPEWIASCIEENKKALSRSPSILYTGLFVSGHVGNDFSLHEAIDLAMESGSQGIAFFNYSALEKIGFDKVANMLDPFLKN